MNDIEIVNVADNGGRWFITVNRLPEYVYRFHGHNMIVAEDGMFRSAFVFRKSTIDQAFAGSTFVLEIDPSCQDHPGVYQDGDKFYITVKGDWWADTHPDVLQDKEGRFINIGYSVPEKLRNMYVYYAGVVDRNVVDTWLSENEVTGYWEYDKQLRGVICQ